ncbi:MAG: tRNA pseudouridine(38-40) synthase TruA [Candidatus Kapabacteria bacterium]|nr:tRNA pseudouridine(38-40) synthase TruA [Candidatus Kapabacteria bacterium]
MSRTLLLLLEYDGTRYAGWQRQPNALTVQAVLEDVFLHLAGVRLHAVAASRTDAGVHARGQVVHIRLPDTWNIPEERIPHALNSLLPEDIRVRRAQLTHQPIHARYDACARQYSYTLTCSPSVFSRHFCWYVPYPFDPELLSDAASIFVGTHDFTTFSKHHPETRHYICTVLEAYWERLCPYRWRFNIRADRFVYGMVRALVGAMLQAARRRRTIEDLQYALAARNRRYASPLVPPNGLVLERVFYPEHLDVCPWKPEDTACLPPLP